ncbi:MULTISPECIES: hypothetical protein [unclassified Ruegeria]|uniref:hypothetical protein n=1 Tax=unclassified Ruegeria TaxID=2625375 RepID=UPI001487DB48|nr:MULTISPECIES: hypothetical protein [unclassified Ruegeria]NOD33399.1 hypothetical protein [Ruegeria sp. HKCCD7296]NOD48540.1 hypothetical protein [Ruegeria sp. HKCCD5849]NOD52158.1 hypothetical protein [Ruegeria sp. HKCCD5851]NOD66816.1 hypothetical protein [Ruegeria sp. HKCCD7303]NOE41373.1 hypothetical protein [Ruegeria sp. HKCCD7319]
MSDVKGGSGILEDAVAAKNTKTWEARLKEAREKRANALADGKVEAREPPRLKPTETDLLPPTDDTEIDEIVSERVRSLHLNEPVSKPPSKSRIPIILAALFCGALLHWAGTKVIETRQSTPENSVVQSNDPIDEPALDETLSPTSAAIEQIPEDPAAPVLEEEIQAPILEKKPVTPSIDIDETPPQETEASLAPPIVFLPSLLEPVLEAPETLAKPVSFSVPVAPQNPASSLLNKRSSLQPTQAVFDPLPKEITQSATPNYSEVKPLQPSKPSIDLEVSLFVPARVSQDTSDRAFELLNESQANVVATARVGYRIRETQVRYYHPADAENADLAAKALGGIARDFTGSGSKTRPGRIEVYLAGAGGGANRTSDNQPNSFDNFIERILNELR